jgi:hypothetical protein
MNTLRPYISDIVLFLHPTFGVLGTMAALWVLVEALNPGPLSQRRMQAAAYVAAICFVLAWIFGGYWYVTYYYADRDVILKGPWPFAHNLFMETKEHLFFIPAILALYLPIITARQLAVDRAARNIVIAVAALIIINSLAIEGAGAVVNHGAKLALTHLATKGTE